MSETKEKSILLLKKYILSKCFKDPDFKKRFLEDPKGTIEKAFNVKFTNEMKIEVLEESDQKLYVVIPVMESEEYGQEFELDDEELKEVTGGIDAPSLGGLQALGEWMNKPGVEIKHGGGIGGVQGG